MRNLILIIAALGLTACGSKDGGSNTANFSVDASQIVNREYETDELILDFQTADLPGNSATIVEIKGVATCNGRVLLTEGSFTLFDFVGPNCAALNGDYTYRLTTKCQGYNQSTYQCGNTTLVDIILE